MIGIDDAVILGLFGIGTWVAKWSKDDHRKSFIRRHGEQIAEENDDIAAAWRRTRPRKQTLTIRRKIKTSLFAPTVIITEKFDR